MNREIDHVLRALTVVTHPDPVINRECRAIWGRLANSAGDAAVTRWRHDPVTNSNEIEAALDLIVAQEPTFLDRLLTSLAATGLTPKRPETHASESGRSVSVNVGQNHAGLVAGGDVSVGDWRPTIAPSTPAGPASERITGGPASGVEPTMHARRTILFLGANPENSTRLRLDREVRAIDRTFQRSPNAKRVRLEQQWAVQVDDLQDSLLRHRPNIVHFSGHGSATDLLFEDAAGNGRPVPGELLERLFGMFHDQVGCVVLNCCHSARQASAIAKVVTCVVGMSTTVGDQAAIHFSVGFYRGLAAGQSVKAAFEHGCLEVDLFEPGQGDLPKLTCLRTEPSDVVFFRAHQPPLAPQA